MDRFADFITGLTTPMFFGFVPFLQHQLSQSQAFEMLFPLGLLLKLIGISEYRLEWVFYISIFFTLYFYRRKRYVAYGAMGLIAGTFLMSIFILV
jgi:hypothetical protein